MGVINDKLGNEEPLLDTLYAFLEQPSPLNPLLASFFSKTIGNLITRKTEQVMHQHVVVQLNQRADQSQRRLKSEGVTHNQTLKTRKGIWPLKVPFRTSTDHKRVMFPGIIYW